MRMTRNRKKMLISNKDLHRALRSIEQARTEMLEDFCSLSEEVASFKLCREWWSPREILEHLYLWEQWVLTNVLKSKGERRRSPLPDLQHPNSRRTVQEIIAPFVSQRVASPPAMIPSGGASAEYWIGALQANRPILNTLPAILTANDLERISFPHFAAGPLNVLQWLEFLAFHIERHRQQMRAHEMRLRSKKDK